MESRESNGSQAFDMRRAAMGSWVATFAFHLFLPDGDFIRVPKSAHTSVTHSESLFNNIAKTSEFKEEAVASHVGLIRLLT